MTNENENNNFQYRVKSWLLACFGETIASDSIERNHRFLEESLELVQACGCTQKEAHQLVDYVFGRSIGEQSQEVGGVMVTLAALCSAQGIDMDIAGETELARIWTKVNEIRAKQAAKPQFSPLPMSYPERQPFSASNENELKVEDVLKYLGVTYSGMAKEQYPSSDDCENVYLAINLIKSQQSRIELLESAIRKLINRKLDRFSNQVTKDQEVNLAIVELRNLMEQAK